MSDWPILPTRQAIRNAVGTALSSIGYRRVRKDAFQRKISADLEAQLSLNGNGVSQSIALGAVSLSANKLAIEIWKEAGRKWPPGPKQLYPGVPLSQHCFRQGHVLDAKGAQRFWHFFELPAAPAPVSLDNFCRDAREIADKFACAIPDLRAALSDPLIGRHADVLEPTVYAMLRDRDGFDTSVAQLKDFRSRLEQQANSVEPSDSTVFIASGEDLDFDAYFEVLKQRCFFSPADG
jgi:hypothetical protein